MALVERSPSEQESLSAPTRSETSFSSSSSSSSPERDSEAGAARCDSLASDLFCETACRFLSRGRERLVVLQR